MPWCRLSAVPPYLRSASARRCARAHGLSAYDSLYIELALRRRAALATYDAAMIAAAPRAGIRLFPFPQGLTA